MGAHDLSQIAFGASAKDAYNSAVAEALHERGHDPYNGTISTTKGFEMKPLAQGKFTRAAIRRWEEAALNATEKWGRCHCLELPRSYAKGKARGVRAYLFVGWAAE